MPLLRADLRLGLLLAAITLAVFGRTCANDFVSYDDGLYVVRNPMVQAGLTGAGVRWAFTTTHAANWHPLTWLCLQLDGQLYGLRPWGYHLTNVLLHAANAALLFWVLLGMTRARWRSLAAAALFALHPLHVEPVAWVAERKELLGTFFGMLALAAYAHYARRPGAARYAGVLAALGLSLMAKPMLVTLPCVFLLLDYWPLRRLRREGPPPPGESAAPSFAPASTLRLLAEKVPLFAVAAASCAVTFHAQRLGGAVEPVASLPLGDRLGNALVACVAYLGKAAWPAGLAVLYPRSREGLPAWQVAGAALFLAGVTAAVLGAGRRRPYLPVGWFWYLGTLVPVIGLVQVGVQALADRYTYVPLTGVFLLLSWGAADLTAGWRLRGYALASGASALLLTCAALSWVQEGYWHDQATLWQHDLRVAGDNFVAHHNLGDYFLQQGRLDEARAHFAEAVRMRPYDADAHNCLGIICSRKGDRREAEGHLREAVRLAPGLAEAHNNLAVVLAGEGKRNEAAAEYSEAIRLSPDRADTRNRLGDLLASGGNLREAAQCYREAVERAPGTVLYRCNLAWALEEQGEAQAATAEYRRLAQLDPDWPRDAGRAAWVLATSPDPQARDGALALRWAKQGCQATWYEAPSLLDALAAAYAETGRFEDAAATARQALGLASARGEPLLGEQLAERLRLYQQRRPYRDNAAAPRT